MKKLLVCSMLVPYLLVTGCAREVKEEKVEGVKNIATIHYSSSNEAMSVWAWKDAVDLDTAWPNGYKATGKDEFGLTYQLPLDTNLSQVGYLFVDSNSGEKDGGDRNLDLSTAREIWVYEGSDIAYYGKPDSLDADEVRIHYRNTNANYEDWSMWVWNDVDVDLSAGWPNGVVSLGQTSYGAYYDIKVTGNSIGIKPANLVDGSGQGGDRNFKKLDKYREIFIDDSSDNVYVGSNMDLPEGIEKAEVLTENKLQLKFSNIDKVDTSMVEVRDNQGEDIEILHIKKIEGYIEVEVGRIDDAKLPYIVKYDGYEVEAKRGIAYIDSLYAYEGQLGARYIDGAVELKLWTPSATKVEVDIYRVDEELVATLPLVMGDKAVWSVVADEGNTGVKDLHNYLYQYRVTNNGEEKRVLDPYAISLAEFRIDTSASNRDKVDSVGKAAIINPALIEEVSSFVELDNYENKKDAIIYEVHIRDFTSQEGLEIGATQGTFDAFREKLEYIKSLGVTHVQLLPVMASYFGDESRSDEMEYGYKSANAIYNWGYDPHSYFAIDGMYSEDSKDPLLRINELKLLIEEIHNQGMGVILDVVYNHTAQLSILEDIVPSYYSYLKADGTPKESFGGSLVGSTHEMARKLIIDSLVYFTEEFKVDGYRFDMMGSMDAETVQQGYDAVAELNPNTLFLGEGWRTYSGDDGVDARPADQDWMKDTDNVAVFSDEMRNELKSGFGSEGEKRFITDGARSIEVIYNNIKGQPSNFVADSPVDVVQYIAAHDNLTLHDVIAHSIRKNSGVAEEEIQKRIRLGNTMVLTSQGVAFIHAGQEYGRTKKWQGDNKPKHKYTFVEETGETFIHDSYDSSDVINAFDWNILEEGTIQYETMMYTKGLIELRKSTDAFRLGSKELVEANMNLEYPSRDKSDKVIAYSVKASSGDTYYVFINGDDKTREFHIANNLSDGLVVVDTERAGVDEIINPKGVRIDGNKVEVDSLGAIVIKVEVR